jgi:hypothetical protein
VGATSVGAGVGDGASGLAVAADGCVAVGEGGSASADVAVETSRVGAGGAAGASGFAVAAAWSSELQAATRTVKASNNTSWQPDTVLNNLSVQCDPPTIEQHPRACKRNCLSCAVEIPSPSGAPHAGGSG